MKVADILDELELFQDFPYPELESLGKYMHLEEVVKGAEIFREGEPGAYLVILVQGSVSILKGGVCGRRVLSHEARGRIVGEMAILDQELRSATCVAETDCELLTLSVDNLNSLAGKHPTVAYRFMSCIARLLSRRLRRVSGMMADFLEN